MRSIVRTGQFKRDVKRMEKRGKTFESFRILIVQLAQGGMLEQKYKDHPLIGNFVGMRECHIEPDWLLIYQLGEDDLTLVRTGTHSDLFG